MKFVGIDPGFKGGIALFENDVYVDVISTPLKVASNGKNLINGEELADYFIKNSVKYAFIEQVHAMPGQGVTSMFSFGKNFGTVIGVLEALKITYIEVSPMKWKKTVLPEEYNHEKTGTIDFVSKTYPTANLMRTKRSKVPHDGLADAIAIAHYGTKIINNIINNIK